MPRGRSKAAGLAVENPKPKGRMSAYAFFVQTCRSEHKKLHPDENVQLPEFSRQCSERWKTMSEAEKRKFFDLADQDKERYVAQMKDFVPPPGATGRRGRRARGNKPPKDPNKPKRALTAFFFYANDERSNVRGVNPDFTVGEVAKELGRQWNEMTSNAKIKYEKQSEEDRARYDREMTAYRAGEDPPVKKLKATNGHAAPAPRTDDDNDENGAAPDDDEDDESD